MSKLTQKTCFVTGKHLNLRGSYRRGAGFWNARQIGKSLKAVRAEPFDKLRRALSKHDRLSSAATAVFRFKVKI